MVNHDEKLKRAFRDAAAMEFAEIEEQAVQPDFSDSFLDRMEQLTNRTAAGKNRGSHLLLRWVACIAVAFLVTGITVGAVCVDGGDASFLLFWDSVFPRGHISTHGYSGETQTDADGFDYIVYSGGEMRIPYRIISQGLKGQEIGVLMFVDGQIQPYSTASDGTVQYMHVFTAQGYGVSEELIFTPVTGADGDKLMVYFLCLVDPDSYLDHATRSCDWVSSRCTYLLYEADPPKAAYPETQDRIQNLRIITLSDVDLTNGWTEEDRASRTEFQFYVNDRYYDSIASVDAEEPLRLRFTLWGTNQNDYGVVFFLNHQPISVDPADVILVSNELGEQVVIEAEVDVSDLSGDILVYAILTARDKKIETYNSYGFAVPTRTYLFVCK